MEFGVKDEVHQVGDDAVMTKGIQALLVKGPDQLQGHLIDV